jgi:hypothetical protein
MSEGDQYDERYFIRGKETGVSLYTEYRWLQEPTLLMAQRIVAHCGIRSRHTVLDFGAARGYLVRALRMLGYPAWGLDASKWAVENCDEEAKPYLAWTPGKVFSQYDWVIAKDVLEHVVDLRSTIDNLMGAARIGVFVVVPLSAHDGCDYVIADYERDITHLHRRTLASWVELFLRPGWRVEAAYRVPGIKDNWYRQEWERGNGFILARRVEE